MEIYLKYFLIGLAIAMPVGVITVEMTKQGLKNGFVHGWAVLSQSYTSSNTGSFVVWRSHIFLFA